MDDALLYFEDFQPGTRLELGTRTLERERIISFAREFDPQPFHIDEDAARDTMFGGIIASGWHTGSTLMRMLVDGLLLRSVTMGSPGVEELKFLKPVYPNVELAGFVRVESARLSASRPGIGLVLLESTLVLPDGSVALLMRSWTMFGCRPAVQ